MRYSQWTLYYDIKSYYKRAYIFTVQDHSDTAALQVQAIQTGDIQGFNYFFELHYPAICYFATSLLKDENAAQEIADDAFVKLWQRHHLFNTPEAIKAFLSRTVRNSAIDIIRRNKTLESLQKEFQNCAETKAPCILQHIIRAETLAQVYAAFDILPPKCREVFNLIYIEGKSYQETAEELKLSINNVRNHKMRALSLLHGQLGNLFVLLVILTFYTLWRLI